MTKLSEKEIFKQALIKAKGNKTLAAENLNIPRTTFRDRLRKYKNDFAHDKQLKKLTDLALKEKKQDRQLASKERSLKKEQDRVRKEKEKQREKQEKLEKQQFETALAKAQGNKAEAASLLNLPRTTFLDRLKKYEGSLTGFYRKLKKSKRYVVTAAQNATPIKESCFKSILKFCEYNNAELVVIPIRYKNPTSIWTDKEEGDDWWDKRLKPYLCDNRQDLGPNLIVLADIKVQPTAVNPLTGFESVGGNKSCILGHPKISFKTVPVLNGCDPKMLATTGCITKDNYTDSKAGKKGEFHHAYAAVVVEIDDTNFHMRQLNCIRDGSFIDLDKEYTPDEVRDAPPAAGLIMGDTHAEFVDEEVLKATFEGKNSIVNKLKPKHLIWHDAFDFYAANHHHRGNPFIAVAKCKSGQNNVAEEMDRTINLIKKYSKDKINIFPASNHPDALARWVREMDWKEDPVNAEFYLKTALYMVQKAKMGENGSEVPDPFKYWGIKLLGDSSSYKFLERDESYKINNIEVGSHGDRGSNGARGSIVTMSKLGVKTVTGHSHAPAIVGGAYQVGTSTKYQLEYNRGPSSWLHTHCIIYANGKRSLINIVNGKYKI